MTTNDPGREPEPTDAELMKALAAAWREYSMWWNTDEMEAVLDRAREYLSGARPMPQTPAHVLKYKLTRYGLQWNGPQSFVATPLPDGYWTPWHLAESRIADLEAEVARLVAERGRYITLYHDLLMSVGYTHPSETRHETAKRYILSAENQNSSPCAAMSRKAASDA